MIIKLKLPHSDWRSAYRYVFDQARHPGAELLGGSTAATEPDDLAREQEWHVQAHCPGAEKTCATFYVAYAPEDRQLAEDPVLRQVVLDRILGTLGIDAAQQPYTVVTHRERDHIHDHVIVNRVRSDGTRWKLWLPEALPKVRSLARELEVEHGLRQLEVFNDEEQLATRVRLPELPPDLAAADRDGAAAKALLRRAARDAMQQVLDEDLPDSYERLDAFQAALEERGLGLDVSIDRTTGRIRGYSVYPRNAEGVMEPHADGRPSAWSLSSLGFRGKMAAATVLQLPEAPRPQLPLQETATQPRAEPAAAAFAAEAAQASVRQQFAAAAQSARGDAAALLGHLARSGLTILPPAQPRDDLRVQAAGGITVSLRALGIRRDDPLRRLLTGLVAAPDPAQGPKPPTPRPIEAKPVEKPITPPSRPPDAPPAPPAAAADRWRAAWQAAIRDPDGMVFPAREDLVRELERRQLAIVYHWDGWRVRDSAAKATVDLAGIVPAAPHRSHVNRLLTQALTGLGQPIEGKGEETRRPAAPDDSDALSGLTRRFSTALAAAGGAGDDPIPPAVLLRALADQGLGLVARGRSLELCDQADPRVALPLTRVASAAAVLRVEAAVRAQQRTVQRDAQQKREDRTRFDRDR